MQIEDQADILLANEQLTAEVASLKTQLAVVTAERDAVKGKATTTKPSEAKPVKELHGRDLVVAEFEKQLQRN